MPFTSCSRRRAFFQRPRDSAPPAPGRSRGSPRSSYRCPSLQKSQFHVNLEYFPRVFFMMFCFWVFFKLVFNFFGFVTTGGHTFLGAFDRRKYLSDDLVVASFGLLRPLSDAFLHIHIRGCVRPIARTHLMSEIRQNCLLWCFHPLDFFLWSLMKLSSMLFSSFSYNSFSLFFFLF